MKTPADMRVLIVEDDFLVSEMIYGTLEDIGYTVIGKATNGLQAVQMTRKLEPDVVLMDIQMPQLDGLQAAAQIQKNCPTPVVILTAHTSTELVEKASKVGVGAYLIKPPQTTEVERAITIAVARHRDLMELTRLNTELQEALAHVKMLSGLLPICSSCKKIRDDEGYWHQVEIYIRERTDAEFTHGLCPDCAHTLYPGLMTDSVADE